MKSKHDKLTNPIHSNNPHVAKQITTTQVEQTEFIFFREMKQERSDAVWHLKREGMEFEVWEFVDLGILKFLYL